MKIKKYDLGKTKAWYLVNEEGAVTLLLIPADKIDDVAYAWEEKNGAFDARSPYIHKWDIGNLAHLQLSHLSRQTGTLKFNESCYILRLHNQEVKKEGKTIKIITNLKAAYGEYGVLHVLTAYEDYDGLSIETTFYNDSNQDYLLEMVTSFSLDNLSPFIADDGPGAYVLHQFKGGWSLEGKHIEQSIEELGLEKSYSGAFVEEEKFGSLGAYPVGRYFPVAAVEDRKNRVFWAAQIVHNATWRMELTRKGDTLSFSGGQADCEFGLWSKKIAPGERYQAPKAYIGVSSVDVEEACQRAVELGNIACEQYGEHGLPVCYNEFCTSWGAPTQEKVLAYADTLKGKGIRYLVIDAGWTKLPKTEGSFGLVGNGTWEIDTEVFPDMKELCRKIREKGMVPGIWFEFEATTDDSAEKYPQLQLKRNGVVIKLNQLRSFWDFRQNEVQEMMKKRVIGLLKENGFGYLKVDYNGNLGSGCDGAETPGEGQRQHLAAVADFFREIKREIPDIIIENCASGGHRLEPEMMGLTAVSSFSDAHEAAEIPYIAANLHNLMLPRQSLIWAVLHEEDTPQRLYYSMCATFLGRICLSGDITHLSKEQWEIVEEGITFYQQCEKVICRGRTHIYGNRGRNTRYPTGTQVVVRENETEMLIVIHSFREPAKSVEIELPEGAAIVGRYGDTCGVSKKEKQLIIKDNKAFMSGALLIKK